MTIHTPVHGKLLQCTPAAPQKQGFLIPFGDFLQNEPILYRTILLPCEPLIYAPISGILLLADPACTAFLLCGQERVALWLHGENGLPLMPQQDELLTLATVGQPLKMGQLLARLELSALRRRGFTPYLSLLTRHPIRIK